MNTNAHKNLQTKDPNFLVRQKTNVSEKPPDNKEKEAEGLKCTTGENSPRSDFKAPGGHMFISLPH
jgi:hypothetical protein